MISAKEARELSAPSLDECMAFIDAKIREAASDKKTSVIISDNLYGPWLYDGATSDPDVKKCLDKLRELGYTVTEHCSVYVGIKISWGQK